MKIFISWSGDQSKAMAEALKEWVPLVIPSAELFFSRDIESGARWSTEIAARLESSNFGIICVTSANQESSWLNFEAGALSKMFDTASVIPLALDLDVSEIKQPLGQFQGQPSTRDGVAAMIAAVNARCDVSRPGNELEALLEVLWPQLEGSFAAARALKTSTPKRRPEREILDEILTTVRDLNRSSERAGSLALFDPSPVHLSMSRERRLVMDKAARKMRSLVGNEKHVGVAMRPSSATVELKCVDGLTAEEESAIKELAEGADLRVVLTEGDRARRVLAERRGPVGGGGRPIFLEPAQVAQIFGDQQPPDESGEADTE